MVDRPNVTYPEPTTSTTNPYPSVSQPAVANESPITSEEILYERLSRSTTRPPRSQSSAAATGFSTTAEFFKLGEKALFNVHRLNQNTEQGRSWSDVVNNVSSRSAAAASSSSGPATSTPAQFSLPGFHLLPDDDRLNSTRPSDQQPTSSRTQESSAPARVRRGPGRPKGSGRGGWRQALKGTEHADLFKPKRMRAERGMRKRGRVKGKPSERNADPGPEYKALQSQAAEAFLSDDLEKAKELALSALQINPEVWASYLLLSDIAQKQGLELESIQILGAGAPVKHDPDTWVDVASRLLLFRGEDRTKEEVDFALKCFEEALKLNASHFNARQARMELYIEQQLWNKARRECGALLALQPDDLEILWKYSRLCDQTKDVDDLRSAIEAYERAFQQYAQSDTFGPADEQWDHLNMYLDMVSKVGPPDKGAYQLKRVARWFLGRQEDVFWNNVVEDDREFDDTPERRIYIPEVQAGRVIQDGARYGLGLPIELRVKLGLFRLQMPPMYHSEAFRHFEHLRSITDIADIEQLYDLFLDVANSLRVRYLYGAAVDYFERIKPVSDNLNREYWMNFAQCCRELGRNSEAEEYYKKIIEANEGEIQARINLIRLYESTSQTMKALPIADQIIQIGRSESLRHENLGTYITACNRVKKNAAREAVAESGTEDDTPRRPQARKKRTAARQASTAAVERDHAASEVRQTPIGRPLAPKPVGSHVANSHPSLSANISQQPGERATNTRASGRKSVPIKNTTARNGSDNEVDDGSQDLDESDEDAIVDPFEDSASLKYPQMAQLRTFKRGADYMNSLRQQRVRVTAEYAALSAVQSQDGAAGDPLAMQKWASHAAALATEFKLLKEFYPTHSRDKLYTGLRTGGDASARNLVAEMEAIKRKLLEDAAQLGSADGTLTASGTAQSDFHGISFGEWHRIFASLALYYASHTQQVDCYWILEKVMMPANIFREDTELSNATFAVALSCALMFNDSNLGYKITRQMRDVEDPKSVSQLAAAFARLEHGESEYSSQKSQSWLASAIVEQDFLAMDPEVRGKYHWGKAGERLAEKLRNSGEEHHIIDPSLLVAYAHSLSTGQKENVNPALPYLFRALAINPESPVVNLSIAACYLVQALRKKLAARQYDVAQGVAFVYRYHDIRVASGRACHLQEAEFNLARMWHLLRMPHLAVQSYDKVVKMSADVQRQNLEDGGFGGEDFSSEAALALQSIYVAAGSEEAARNITDECLVL